MSDFLAIRSGFRLILPNGRELKFKGERHELKFPFGNITVLQGESGCGKSLLLRTIVGVEPAGSQVKNRPDPKDIEIHLTFQEHASALHPFLPIFSQVVASPFVSARGEKGAIDALKKAKVPQRHYFTLPGPGGLSSGEKQRASLALVLPSLRNLDQCAFLFDEPTSALDNILRVHFAQQFIELMRKGAAIVLVTHEYPLVTLLYSMLHPEEKDFLQEIRFTDYFRWDFLGGNVNIHHRYEAGGVASQCRMSNVKCRMSVIRHSRFAIRHFPTVGVSDNTTPQADQTWEHLLPIDWAKPEYLPCREPLVTLQGVEIYPASSPGRPHPNQNPLFRGTITLPRYALLVGPSGSGKTSFLQSLVADEKSSRYVSKGRVEWHMDGKTGKTRAKKSLDRRQIRIVSQDCSTLFYPWMKVGLALDLGNQKEEARQELENLFPPGLAPSDHRLISSLSAGEKRRVAIAVCLAGDPEVLLWDEPTVGLDPDACERLIERMLKRARKGKADLVISHDIDPFAVYNPDFLGFKLPFSQVIGINALPQPNPRRPDHQIFVGKIMFQLSTSPLFGEGYEEFVDRVKDAPAGNDFVAGDLGAKQAKVLAVITRREWEKLAMIIVSATSE